jgi:hypothetical protein
MMWQQIDRNYGLAGGWLLSAGAGTELHYTRWSRS